MTTTTLSPVRVAAPPNPAGIPRETSLVELQDIKAAWVQAAQDAGFRGELAGKAGQYPNLPGNLLETRQCRPPRRRDDRSLRANAIWLGR